MRIFFVGIKGSGMSSLAQILKGFGDNIEGSDIDKFVFTETRLREMNIPIYKFSEVDFIKENYDEIIIGNAFGDDHPEVIKAKKSNSKIIHYYDKLNEIIKNKKSIAVAGTNGKTTTTGLLEASLKNYKPSYLIGDGEGFGNIKSDLFAFEACEYRGTFLNYDPEYIIINNIEMDHPDFFTNIEHVIEIFQQFAEQGKIIIANGDDDNLLKLNHENIYYFGTGNNADLKVNEINYVKEGIKFELVYEGQKLGEFILPFYGEHMLYNSLGVILVNLLLGNEIENIIKNLSQFTGVNRRFNEEILSKENHVVLIDDYAHHPTAIKLTLEAVRQKYPKYQIITIFQPHTFSRTAAFLEEFAQSLILSDKIILADIFGSAREKNGTVSIKDLEKEINAISLGKLILEKDITGKEKETVICILGAGDIDVLYKEKLEKKFK